METNEEKNIENEPLEDNDAVTSAPDWQRDPVLDFKDTVKMDDKTLKCFDPNDLNLEIELESEVKLFAKKFSHHERECCKTCDKCGNSKCCEKPSQGDDIGFTLVFGNFGNKNFINNTNSPTLEDTLKLGPGVRLTLVDLCIDDGYQLVRSDNGFTIDPCSADPRKNVFTGNVTLTLKKNGNSKFSIPCHSICCISMLFKVDPQQCKNC